MNGLVRRRHFAEHRFKSASKRGFFSDLVVSVRVQEPLIVRRWIDEVNAQLSVRGERLPIVEHEIQILFGVQDNKPKRPGRVLSHVINSGELRAYHEEVCARCFGDDKVRSFVFDGLYFLFHRVA